MFDGFGFTFVLHNCFPAFLAPLSQFNRKRDEQSLKLTGRMPAMLQEDVDEDCFIVKAVIKRKKFFRPCQNDEYASSQRKRIRPRQASTERNHTREPAGESDEVVLQELSSQDEERVSGLCSFLKDTFAISQLNLLSIRDRLKQYLRCKEKASHLSWEQRFVLKLFLNMYTLYSPLHQIPPSDFGGCSLRKLRSLQKYSGMAHWVVFRQY